MGTTAARSCPGSPQFVDDDIRDKYDLGDVLGNGSFGQVRSASLKSSPSSAKVAVKMVERTFEDGNWSSKEIFTREVGLLQDMHHENIISFYDFYEDVHFLYVVMELCRGGEVFTKLIELKRFSERHAAILGRQMLSALDYIHKLRIAHRDVKAENFMLSEPDIESPVKMIDFGMATRFEDDQFLTELCGSPHYLAPELIGQKYTYRVDVWALGVLQYLIMCGHYPYDANNNRDLMIKILNEPVQWPKKVKLSSEAMRFLKGLLEREPKRRLTAERALQHQWIEGINDARKDVELPAQVLRKAHRTLTASRKNLDPEVEEQRNKKFRELEEAHRDNAPLSPKSSQLPLLGWTRHVARSMTQTSRQGCGTPAGDASLGAESPKSARGCRLAVARRPGRTATAPSGTGPGWNLHCAVLRDVIPRLPGRADTPSFDESLKRKDARAVSNASSVSKRLMYIGELSEVEEKSFATMYSCKRREPRLKTPVKPIHGPVPVIRVHKSLSITSA